MKKSISSRIIGPENSKSRDVIVLALLIIVPVLIYFTGGTKNVYVQFMYVPIIISAIEKTQIKVIIVAIIAGLLIGPYMPVDVHTGDMQSVQGWLFRIVMFISVGEMMHFLHKKAAIELSATKLVLQSISEGICVIDENDKIIFANDLFTSIHDLNKSEFIGENIFSFLHRQYSLKIKDDCCIELYNAIKMRKEVKNLLIPNVVNSYGEITSEYNVYTTKANGVNNSIIVVRNIEEQLNYNRYLHKLSYTDALTGLPNRRAFRDYIATLEDVDILPIGVLFLDIDGIKFINDSFGFQKGDEVIMMVSNIMNTIIKKQGYVARLSGDEFIGIAFNASSTSIDEAVNRIYKEVENIRINSLSMKVSCGYSIVDNFNDIKEAIKLSENNMYIDKNTSNNSMRNNPIDTIMNTLHEKDAYSEHHSQTVSMISANIAKALSLPGNQIKEIEQAALLHDIGKIIVPINILTKEGSLTEEEYHKMKEHSEIGYRLLSTMKSLNNIPEMVLSHHERWDGKGYPHQVKGEEIPLGARIISIADSYNAMTTNRPYRKKFTEEAAFNEIVSCRGTQFDPQIIDVFEKNFNWIIKEYNN